MQLNAEAYTLAYAIINNIKLKINQRRRNKKTDRAKSLFRTCVAFVSNFDAR